MSTHLQSDFTDFSIGQFMRQQRAESERAELARPGTSEQLLVEEFSYTTDAACLLRADIQLPPDLYAFVDALIGVSAGSTEFFAATDARIAKRAARSAKWVQRKRDDLSKWQHRENFSLADIQDHFTDGEGKRHPHKYRVHLHRLAVAVRLDAEASARWSQSPSYALSAAARRMRDSIPEWSPRKTRGRKREPTAEAIINRNVKAAATHLREATERLRAAELLRMARGWQTTPAIDADRVVQLFAAMHEFRTLLGAQEFTADAAQNEAESTTGQNVHKGNHWSKMNSDPVSPSDSLPAISDSDHADYHFDLREHAGRAMDAGMSEVESDRASSSEVAR
ncbi:MAG: hypothetical protein M3430_03645 [Acidobacteriota bacterium]|nr:hypothetical protein [Acidobacteriota bacterium]